MVNQAVTKVNLLFLPDNINILTNLRTSRELIQVMREYYGHLSLKNFQGFVEEKEESQCIDISNVHN